MPEKPEIPSQMRVLSHFTGTWKNVATFVDRQGNARFETVFHSRSEPVLEGRALMIRSSHGDEPAGISWFFYDEALKKYVFVALDAWGNYDEFSGNFKGDKLVLTSRERMFRNGRIMMWRRTYTRFGNRRHEIEMHYSTDGGETWILSNTQVETRER